MATATLFLTTTNSGLTVPGSNWDKALAGTAPSSASLASVIAASSAEDDYAFSGLIEFPVIAGTFNLTVQITAGNASVGLRTRLARVNSSGVVQAESAWSSVKLTTAGVKAWMWESLDLGTFGATDQLRIQFQWSNEAASPIEVVQGVSVEGTQLAVPSSVRGPAALTTPLPAIAAAGTTQSSALGAAMTTPMPTIAAAGAHGPTGTAAMTVPLPIIKAGPAPLFALRGVLRNTEGTYFQGSPIHSHGDIDVVYNAARDELDAYFTSSGLAHSRKSFDATNMRDGWSLTPLKNPSQPQAQIEPDPANPYEMSLNDATGLVYHAALGRWFAYYEGKPGTRPAGAQGWITVVMAAWTAEPNALLRSWTKVADPVAEATLPEEQGFVWQTSSEGDVYRGGLSECSPIWDPVNQRVVLFYRALTEESPGGRWRWRLIRRLETLPAGPGSGDGVTFDAPQLVFDPVAETGPSEPGYETSGAHHYRVKRDPVTGILHLVYMHGVGTADHGFYHASSTDGGASWVKNTRNPVLSLEDLASQAEVQTEPVPGGEPEASSQNIIGGPCLVFDPTPSSNRLWLFHDGSPSLRYTDPTYFYVYEGSRAALGSILGTAGISTPLPTISASANAIHQGAAALTTPLPTISAAGLSEATATGNAAMVVPLPTIAAGGVASTTIPGTAALTVPLPTISATGEPLHHGTASMTVPLPTVSAGGVASTTIPGTAALTTPLPVVAGAGDAISTLSGTAAVTAPLPVLAASGLAGLDLTAEGPHVSVALGVVSAMRAFMVSASLSSSLLAQPNGKFSPPNPTPNGSEHYVSFRIEWGDTDLPCGLGGARPIYRTEAVLVASFHVAAGRQDALALDRARALLAFLAARNMDGITYRPGHLVERGRDGAWHTIEAQVPLYRDDTLATAANAGTQQVVSQDDAIDIARQRMDAQVVTALGVPVLWSNAAKVSGPGSTWVQVLTTFGSANRIDSAGISSRGVLQARIRWKGGTGLRAGLEVADAITLGFRCVMDQGVQFDLTSTRHIGLEGHEHRVDVRVPFSISEAVPA